jgi:hypothetical protein
MSFSFNASGNKADLIAQVGQEAASTEQFPQQFADAINLQLDALPADAEATLVCYGHTGWTAGQNAGNINLHVEINVRVDATAKETESVSVERTEAGRINPGPERFPEGFAGDPPAGESANGTTTE